MAEVPHNLDELVAPAWIDEKFFENIFKKSENDPKISVSSIDIKPATKVGEHFASVMYRVKVEFTTKTGESKVKSLIVKTKPFVESDKKDMLQDSKVFDIEIKMYTKTIPEMHRLLRAIGDKTQFGPILLYSTKEPTDTLVFEDLCEKNFEVSPTPLNYEEAKMVYEQIAKWHACSFHMAADRSFNDEFEDYNENLYNGLLGDGVVKMLLNNYTTLFEVVSEWPEFSKYEKNFKNYMNNFIEKGIAAYKPSKGYNVLCHADLHCKNLMLRKEEGKVVDVVLLDFQISSYCTPALDLAYGTFSIQNEECRLKHRDELIHFYYQTFADTLKKIGYLGTIPKMIELQEEILRYGYFLVNNMVGFLPFTYIDFTQFTPEEMFQIDPVKVKEFQRKLYAQEPLNTLLKKYILEFIHKGFL